MGWGKITEAPAWRQELNLGSALASGTPEFTSPNTFPPQWRRCFRRYLRNHTADDLIVHALIALIVIAAIYYLV